MTATVHTTVTLIPVSCYQCGAIFGMASDFSDDRLRDGRTWYCPAGHGQIYGDSTKAQLEKAQQSLAWNREALAAERSQHQHTANRLAGTQGALTKTRKRANAGVCLDCHRTFPNLVRHRETKHPEEAK